MRNNNRKKWSDVSMRMAGGDEFFNALNKGIQDVRSSNVDVDKFLQSPNTSVDVDKYLQSPNTSVDLSEYIRSPSVRNSNSSNSSVNTDKYFQSPTKPQSTVGTVNLDRFLQSPNKSNTNTSSNDDRRDPSNYRNPIPAPLPTREYNSSRFERSPDRTIQPYTPSERVYTPGISVDMDAAADRFAALDKQNQDYKSTVGANNAEATLQRAINQKAANDVLLGNKDHTQRGLNIANAFINNAKEQNPLDIEALDRDLRRRPGIARDRAELEFLKLYGDRYRYAREEMPDYQGFHPLKPVEPPDLGGIAEDYLDRIDNI